MSLFDDEFVALHFFGGSPYLPNVCCSGSGRVGRFLQISDNEVRKAGNQGSVNTAGSSCG